LRLLDDPDAQVRGAAVWALSRLHPNLAAELAAQRGSAETHSDVQDEWRAAA
jgi:epoxyqueuosine reductase